MAWGLVYAPGRHDCAEELEATDVHASLPHIAFRQPDAEARRGAGVAQPPKNNGSGKLISIVPVRPVLRPRTIGVVEDLAPFLAIEGLERPILKAPCIAF